MGYVYILVNDSMPGLIKIGKTARNSCARARELSTSTGVPTPFKVAFELSSKNYEKLEREMHSKLFAHRIAQNREFFRYPVDEAMRLLKELHSQRTAKEKRIAKKELEKAEKTRISCSNKNCTQGLWIPITNRTLKITCPKCKTVFEYSEQEKQRKKAKEKQKHKELQRHQQQTAQEEKRKEEKAQGIKESPQRQREEMERKKEKKRKEKLENWVFGSFFVFLVIVLLQVFKNC